MNTMASTTTLVQLYGQQVLLRRIRRWTVLFIALLALSGITAFPVQTELHALLNIQHSLPEFMRWWLLRASSAVDEVATNAPFLLYGYDWLAFAHLVIALFFIGVYRQPVQNRWVIRTGMMACVGVFFLAFICGQLRGIPFFWTMVDCSFGAFGLLPLFIVDRLIRQLKETEEESH